MKKKILNFLSEVRIELEKVTWPEKRALKITTGVVVFLMVMFAFYIGVVDIIFSKVIALFLR
ncbi:MAG: preprotein translocase subunit SecE [Candidatus Omnitrophica bacterium]|nr:preprotein translocase subunit SecE [Candidatus Omnitrophota bacterium]MCM8777481.1 preprotein translocase subunit SecE [Candidatus Omnitrophota bacterium]